MSGMNLTQGPKLAFDTVKVAQQLAEAASEK